MASALLNTMTIADTGSGKTALGLTIGAISVWGGPVGWVAGGVYFIGDAAGWWGDWGNPIGVKK